MVDLQLGAPTRTHLQNLVLHNKANTGVRWVHITTRNETSKKCARPDNKYQ